MRGSGATSRTIAGMRTVTLAGASLQVPGPVQYYRGFTLRESTGAAPAVVRIWDGAGATGSVLEEISLLASESARELYGDQAPTSSSGNVYVQIVSGAVVGSVRVD